MEWSFEMATPTNWRLVFCIHKYHITIIERRIETISRPTREQTKRKESVMPPIPTQKKKNPSLWRLGRRFILFWHDRQWVVQFIELYWVKKPVIGTLDFSMKDYARNNAPIQLKFWRFNDLTGTLSTRGRTLWLWVTFIIIFHISSLYTRPKKNLKYQRKNTNIFLFIPLYKMEKSSSLCPPFSGGNVSLRDRPHIERKKWRKKRRSKVG